ncbi:BgiBFREP24 [Biomphalaria glabrata]|nr:BgiBFREP24 [Biomphalaria glabrata]
MDFLKKAVIFLLTACFYVSAEKVTAEIAALPQKIRIGLTTDFSIRCLAIPNQHDAGLSKILTLSIKKVQNDVPVTLAVVTPLSAANVMPEARAAKAHGALDHSTNYLNISWKNPESDLAGEYICEGIGVEASGKNIAFSDSIFVSYEYASTEEYVSTLFQLHKELDQSQAKLKAAYTAGNKTQSELVETQTRLSRRQLPDDCIPVVSNATGCDDPKLTVGYHILEIVPKDGLGPIKVLCHVRIQGEGWIVFQKRFDGSVDFYRNFRDYEVGFGTVSPTTEYWLGLENLRRLLVDNGDENGLRVDMTERGTAFNFTRIYPIFRVGPGDGYTLIADGYSDGGKGLSENSGAKFSTYDNDHSLGCPSSLRLAGWWFHEGCGFVNLNGLWGLASGEASMFWYEIYNHPTHSMQATEMKFRPFPSPVRV